MSGSPGSGPFPQGLPPAAERWGFIHRFVPGPGDPAGLTLLLLHGTGGTEDDLLPLGRELAPGAALLSPRGRVLEHGMPRWFRRTAPGVFDVEDLKARARELGAFLRAAAGHYGIDPGRLVAVGYSNGANIASGLMLLEPGLVRTAILLRPMVPFEPSVPPDLHGTRVWLAGGVRDAIAPAEQVERLATLLETCGAGVSTYWHQGGHELSPGDVREARAWLDRGSTDPRAGSGGAAR